MKQSSKSAGMPILDFAVDSLKELKGVSIRASLHEQIAKYAVYVEATKGQKPDRSAVVDKGLEFAFQEDTGFQKFLKNGGVAKPGSSPATGPASVAPAQS